LVARLDLHQAGLLHGTVIYCHGTSGVKATSPRRAHRTGWIFLEYDVLAAHIRSEERDCRHQGLRLGVQWPVEELAAGR